MDGRGGWKVLVLGVVLALDGVGEAREEGDETRELFAVFPFPFVYDRENALGACGVDFCDSDDVAGGAMGAEIGGWWKEIDDGIGGKGKEVEVGKEEGNGVRGGGGG